MSRYYCGDDLHLDAIELAPWAHHRPTPVADAPPTYTPMHPHTVGVICTATSVRCDSVTFIRHVCEGLVQLCVDVRYKSISFTPGLPL
jgi:hypothetical protein